MSFKKYEFLSGKGNGNGYLQFCITRRKKSDQVGMWAGQNTWPSQCFCMGWSKKTKILAILCDPEEGN